MIGSPMTTSCRLRLSLRNKSPEETSPVEEEGRRSLEDDWPAPPEDPEDPDRGLASAFSPYLSGLPGYWRTVVQHKILSGVDANGALLVEMAGDGVLRPLHAGEVSIRL